MSITEDLRRLCELQLGTAVRAHVEQPSQSRQKSLQVLKKRAYDTLFEHLGFPYRRKPDPGRPPEWPSSKDKIVTYAYLLRTQRRFDDANHLEEMLSKLVSGADKAEVDTLLRLLVALAGSGGQETAPPIGHAPKLYPQVFPDKKIPCVLPDGPLCYGDTTRIPDNSHYYMHYPRHIFEMPGVTDDVGGSESKYASLDPKVFSMEPGQGLPGAPFNSHHGGGDNPYTKHKRETLFQALVQSRTDSLNTKLELPDLSSLSIDRAPVIKVPKLYESSCDEGFAEQTLSQDSSISVSSDHTDESAIWEEAVELMKSGKPRCYAWSNRGKPKQGPVLRFLTESGPEVVDELYDRHMKILSLLDPAFQAQRRVTVSEGQLVKDTLNLLIGLPSESFAFIEEKHHFEIRPGLHVSGITPEVTASLCQDFLECGSIYWKLLEFSKPSVLDSFYNQGLVFQAFKGGLRKYMQYYVASILSVTPKKTMLQLHLVVSSVMQQLRHLGNLCMLTSDAAPGEDRQEFPTGVPLMSFLYNEALNCVGTLHYPVILTLLRLSCNPYLRFVQEWLFYGTFSDPYNEFMIQVRDEFLNFRDRQYWVQGYVMAGDVTEKAPTFLQDLAQDIYTCGKSINLLKTCSPQHFLFSTPYEIPQVLITYSEEELNVIDKRSQSYLGHMLSVSRQHTLSRAQMKQDADEARQALLKAAIEISMKETQRIQANIQARREAQDNKKRKEFKELKAQMEADLRRRASEQESEREADKVWIESKNKQEILEAQVEADLEEQTRQQLIEYYAGLTAEATRREERALWKVRRHKLDEQRMQFLEENENLLMSELKEKPVEEAGTKDSDDPHITGSDVIDDGTQKEAGPKQAAPITDDKTQKETIPTESEDVLPTWAQVTGPTEAVGEDAEVKEAELPQWAKRELKRGLVPAFGFDHGSPESLPGWAQKGLSGDDGPRRVYDVQLAEQKDEAELATLHPEEDQETKDGGAALDISPTKTTIKIVTGAHPSKLSSEETDMKSTVKHIEGAHITKESEQTDSKAQVKGVHGVHVTQETEEQPDKIHIKLSTHMTASTETESAEEKVHLRTFQHRNVQKESEEPGEVQIPHLKRIADKHSSVESKGAEWVVKKRSLFGHVSQVSKGDYDIQLPKLKKREDMHASLESDWRSFEIKPHVRKVAGKSVNMESQAQETYKPMIKMQSAMHASTESEYQDVDKLRMLKFQQRNVHGHSADSTVQKLLYGEMFGQRPESDDLTEVFEELPEFEVWHDSEVEKYTDNFDMFGNEPMVDLMSRQVVDTRSLPQDDVDQTDCWTHDHVPLPALLQQSVHAPVRAQIRLVNQCVLNYFFGDLRIQKHFDALRSYMFLENGEFGQLLGDLLCERLAYKNDPAEIFNPVFLNEVIRRALGASIHIDDALSKNLSFALKYFPDTVKHHAVDAFDCLLLTYKVDWPLNIVITDVSLMKYSKVFSFMMQIKWIVWVVKDIWHQLKRDAVIHKASTASQVRQLYLIKHEMEHLVRVMQDYITNQVINVTWHEFQQSLDNNVKSLDDVHDRHMEYLNKSLFRCLLNKKAEPVMKIIQSIFSLILKLRLQLLSQPWERDEETGDVTHPAYREMLHTYQLFKNYSVFLLKVVSKLTARGYQPHLQELVLQVNFNEYYAKEQ